jgi:putative acetyltransferase
VNISIAIEDPLQDDVRALIVALNQAMQALTPREFCHHMTAEQMAGRDTTVFIARDEEGVALAMGALRRHGDVGEVKRMYTRPEFRDAGLGGMILASIELEASNEGLLKLVLETGHRHPAAWRVYERSGFKRCGPVLGYQETPYSVFYHKSLVQVIAA